VRLSASNLVTLLAYLLHCDSYSYITALEGNNIMELETTLICSSNERRKFHALFALGNILDAGRGGRITSRFLGRQVVRMELRISSINDAESSASVTRESLHNQVQHNTLIYLNR
jgi:hypothetical protein